MTIIDAHQHVWDLSRARYGWLGPAVAPINRSFGFEELKPVLDRLGIGATVLVQAADNNEDTDWMLQVAARHAEVAGVVGYVPLEHPDEAAGRLEMLRDNRLLVGIRNLIHDRPDPDFLLRDDVAAGLALVERAGLTFDLVSELPRHLEHAPVLARRYPQLRIVIDHLSKPPIGSQDREPWWTLLAEAARYPNVYAKVSGLYPATDKQNWSVSSIRPFIHHALEVFGPSRLMYGGDWPVSVLAGGYERVWAGLNAVLDELALGERAQILSGSAAEFYSLDLNRLS